jgi:hypothetical protein
VETSWSPPRWSGAARPDRPAAKEYLTAETGRKQSGKGTNPQNQVVTFWLLLIWPLDILDMIWLGRLLAESRKASDPGRRKAGAAFACLFLVRYLEILELMIDGKSN